jgi:hypothetical protein
VSALTLSLMLLLLLLWISVTFFCIFFGRPGVNEVRGLKRPYNHLFNERSRDGEPPSKSLLTLPSRALPKCRPKARLIFASEM